MTEAIAMSLRDLDPNNPWVKDSQGRHTNLSAIYDWPDANSDEEDSDVNQVRLRPQPWPIWSCLVRSGPTKS